ncbi:MAG: diacylglycerol kinase [Alphaproteobacteria bacterium]|nr:diacylglycerol kinase [Alphaproteobacteria bacterium]
MGGIGVVTNPRSRRNRKNPQLRQELSYILGERGRLEAPTDLDALRRSLGVFRDREVDIIAINGGDGTAHVVLTAMLEVYAGDPLPKVALLRGGTMNTVASGLGIWGRPAPLLGRLAEQYHSGEPFRTAERNLLVVDGHQAGFLFGNGLISNFLQAYYEGSEPSPAKAARLLTRAIGSTMVGGKYIQRLTRPVRCRVTVGHRRWESEQWLTVAAGTVDDIGLRFRPFYRSLAHPGHMHAVGCMGSPWSVVSRLWRIWRARPIEHPEIVDAVVERMVIEAEEPLGYMVDGDFHQGGQRLEVTVGPRVQLLIP